MIIYDDPIDFELSQRQAEARADATTAPQAGVLTDVQGSPRESWNPVLYGQIMAAREMLRRSAE